MFSGLLALMRKFNLHYDIWTIFYDFSTRFFMHYSLGFLGHDICTNFSYDFCSKTFLACIMHFKNQIVLFALSYIFVAFMYFPLSDMCFEIQPKPEVKIESSICTNLFDLTKFVLHVSGHYFCTFEHTLNIMLFALNHMTKCFGPLFLH